MMMNEKMKSKYALELANGILGLRRNFCNMDKENGKISQNDLYRLTDPHKFIVPEKYFEEATEIVTRYNEEIRELSLKIISENI
ncbi:hypothetical protein ACR3IL_09520 [Streptococcus iniae]|nr:hypothetical protein BKX95_10130 [Streptococcus iniae]